MCRLSYVDSVYRTPPTKVSLWSRALPALIYYSRFTGIVYSASARSKREQYSNTDWCISSLGCLRGLERAGVGVEIAGIEHMEQLDGPCVVIGNHMSVLETVVLPVIIQPIRDVTFVVKQSLLTYPIFRHIMKGRDPVAVSRTNPREDLKAVLEGGTARLQKGVTIVVFPQTTRTTTFDPEQFSTIGVKLARKADVPIVPLALKTDAWGNGKRLKDFGRIDSSISVHFAFGEPMRIKGRGTEEHEAVIEFIGSKLQEWRDREEAE